MKSFTIIGPRPGARLAWSVQLAGTDTRYFGTMPEATSFIEREYERKPNATQVSIAIPGEKITGVPGKYRVRAYHGRGHEQTVLDCDDLTEATWAARCLIQGIEYVPKAWQR